MNFTIILFLRSKSIVSLIIFSLFISKTVLREIANDTWAANFRKQVHQQHSGVEKITWVFSVNQRYWDTCIHKEITWLKVDYIKQWFLFEGKAECSLISLTNFRYRWHHISSSKYNYNLLFFSSVVQVWLFLGARKLSSKLMLNIQNIKGLGKGNKT